MVSRRQKEASQRRLNRFLEFASSNRLSNDIEFLSIREFNHKYHSNFKNKKSLMGTVRRIESHLQQPIRNQRRDKFSGASVGNLKNAHELKFGRRTRSYQQVNLVIKYSLICPRRRETNRWITFSGGIGGRRSTFSLETMLSIAKDIRDAWINAVEESNCQVIIHKQETKVYRWLR